MKLVFALALAATWGAAGAIAAAPAAPTPASNPPKHESMPQQAQAAGVTAQIARWFDDRAAAISLRFDDSSPSHLDVAVPLLDRCALVGTFFINPGRSGYKRRQADWEAVAARGVHEFANHTMHHRGAKDDDQADSEIGECSRYIWSLFPDRSKLLAFRRGGGTQWRQQKPMRHWRRKWHLISAPHSASVGTERCVISDLAAFRAKTEQIVRDGGWVSFYYHTIGVERGMSIGRQLFSDMMYYLRSQRQQVWFGGVAQVHKYQAERVAAKVTASEIGPRKVRITVECGTDTDLYDQPLTLLVVLPRNWSAHDVQACDEQGKPVLIRREASGSQWHRLLIPVPPVSADYTVSVPRAVRTGARPILGPDGARAATATGE